MFRDRALVFSILFTLVMLVGQFVQSVHDFRNLEAHTAGKIESLAGMARAVVKDQLVDVRQLLGVMDLWITDGPERQEYDQAPDSRATAAAHAALPDVPPRGEILVLDEHRRFAAESDLQRP